ncbi:hypothetical protein J7T55_007953 [Diaporthe amygdali]|uniref:uncharacterized protein n=1 Tax=Phomopsis amygdali TaxID=1214568 RepID=UPI0022FE6552|nr:uncharacterized protein J7T55_007953 [Diaporthe amygdali]KAJ0114119.1 hypothetical protein J7T55_007953 [Diaporthe amygdali]
MTRQILSVRSIRSRLFRSSSPHNGDITQSDGALGVLDSQGNDAEENASANEAAWEDVHTIDNRSYDTPVASIERSPSPAFTFAADHTAAQSTSIVSAPKSATSNQPTLTGCHNSTHESTSSFTSTHQSLTPTVSISPPPQTNPTAMWNTSVHESTRTNLTPGLQRLGLSGKQASAEPIPGLNMTEVGAALDELDTNTNDFNPGPRVNETLAVKPRRSSRRRSTPRPETVIHRVEDEEPPSDEFNHPVFQQRLADTRKALVDLTDVLSSNSIHLEPDSTMKGLHERAKMLSRFQPLSTRTVGFVGDSGVGKSSLLNSLLDHRGLARTTNNGAACTCVVTEYHHHGEDCFIIEVDKFSSEEIHDQLAELLVSYRTFHLHNGVLDREEHKYLEERANIAADTFRTMFRGILGDESWLLKESQEVILEQFQTWVSSANALQSRDRQVVTSLEDCSSLLMQLTSEVPAASAPATWPYIRKIRVYLKAHILSKGLVLVDLPGLRDLNSARRNITERYILKCHEIFAVCNIGRATTDVGVLSVFNLAREAGLAHVGIVCTKSDDINFDEIKNDWQNKQADVIKKLRRSLSSIDEKLEEVDEELMTFQGLSSIDLDTQEELLKLLSDKRELKRQRNTAKYNLHEYAVKTRNAHVMKGLSEKYLDPTTEKPPRVFCVSNTMYWEMRKEERSEAEPFLNLSGIIAIRKHSIAMVAASQLRISKNFLSHDVPALLSEIELWVQSGAGSTSAEEKEAARKALDSIEAQLFQVNLVSETSPLSTVGSCLKSYFRDHIWRGTYAAFCRAMGDHSTAAVGYRNWNKEAMSAMVSDVKDSWKNLQAKFQDQWDDVDQFISDSWDEAICFLDTEWPSSNVSESEIRKAIHFRRHLLITGIEEVFGTHDRNLSSFFGKVMCKVYVEAANERDRGSDKRRKAIVARTLTNEEIFKTVIEQFRNGLQQHANKLQEELDGVVSEQLDALRGTLDIVRRENVAEESERDPNFRRRVADEVAKIRGMMSD